MAVPDLLDNGSVTQNILVQAQLASGDNNYQVPADRAWSVRSFVLCNTSAASVTVSVLVVPNGGTARTIVSDYVLAADETLIFDPSLVAMLPELATLRINSSAATSVDVLATGVVTA
jgi:hypothetical protein